jgi:hypothetical protein
LRRRVRRLERRQFLAREDAAQKGRALRLYPLEITFANPVGGLHKPLDYPLLQRMQVGLIDLALRKNLRARPRGLLGGPRAITV